MLFAQPQPDDRAAQENINKSRVYLSVVEYLQQLHHVVCRGEVSRACRGMRSAATNWCRGATHTTLGQLTSPASMYAPEVCSQPVFRHLYGYLKFGRAPQVVRGTFGAQASVSSLSPPSFNSPASTHLPPAQFPFRGDRKVNFYTTYVSCRLERPFPFFLLIWQLLLFRSFRIQCISYP